MLGPVRLLLRPFSGCELNYRADLGPGLLILHSSLGIVVSSHVQAGRCLVLTGGNVIGTRPTADGPGRVTIGSHVNFGAHATALGPVVIGDNARLGAGAVVISDVEPHATVVGVPAHRVG